MVVREQEEKAMTVAMIAACITVSVFILKANFMPGASSEGGEEKRLHGECT